LTLNILVFLPEDGSAFGIPLSGFYLIPECDRCDLGILKIWIEKVAELQEVSVSKTTKLFKGSKTTEPFFY